MVANPGNIKSSMVTDSEESLAPSPFARVAEGYFPKNSRILAIRGEDNDGKFFVRWGHTVVATRDTQESTRSRFFSPPGVFDQTIDVAHDLPNIATGTFNVVYANATLDRYDWPTAHGIYQQAHRILKVGGVLAVASVAPERYMRDIVDDRFAIESLRAVTEPDKSVTFTRCIATKT